MDDDQTMPLKPEQGLTPHLGALLNLGFPSTATEGKSPDSDEPAALQRHLPQYRVRDIIGRGGMGNVLRVDDPKLARAVALKVMKLGPEATEEERGRFVREATVLARLAHPNIVPIYDLGADGTGSPFYTMKLVKGCTLAAILKDLRDGVPDAVALHSLDRLLGVFRKVCDAIAFAHSRDVLHRDLKPENIMVGEFGEVLVMDWGLAKLLRGEEEAGSAGGLSQSIVERSRASLGPSTLGATLDGALMGTPQYMAPEQARGEVETLDARADIYALGAILYHILALRPPVEGKDAWEVVGKVGRGEIEPLTAPASPRSGDIPVADGPARAGGAHHPGQVAGSARERRVRRQECRRSLAIPDSLAAVVRKAMALDKAARYQSVADLQREIEAYQSGFATGAEHASAWKQLTLLMKRNKAATLGIAAVLAVGAVFGTKAIIEGRRAEREAIRANATLADLRKTAPTFFEQAKLLTDGEKLPEALEKIGIALALNPDEPGFHAQRGHILQSMERFPEATAAYATALRLNPQEPHAAANLELSRTLAAAREKDGDLPINTRIQWRDVLIQQGRATEAIFAGRSTEPDAKMLPIWQAKIDAWLGKKAPKLRLGHFGWDLDLRNLSLKDLSPLRDIPVQSLNISDNPHIKDFSPLANCPIIHLRASLIPDLVDLSPLKRMKLRWLQVHETGVRDLSPLAGMQTLQKLSISRTGVTDLTPIRQARLYEFGGGGAKFPSLEPLRGHPIALLTLRDCRIESLDPVGDAPLVELSLYNCGHVDLAALRTRTLRKFIAEKTTCDHLEVLAEMTNLEYISYPSNLTDPSILRKLPRLREIAVPGKVTRDAATFWREYDAQQAAGKK